MTELLGTTLPGKPGQLECGCVISLVVSVDPPHANIRWCLTHGHAHKLRQAMNLIAGYAAGAQAKLRSTGAGASSSHLAAIEDWAVNSLPAADTAGYVKQAGPGKGAR